MTAGRIRRRVGSTVSVVVLVASTVAITAMQPLSAGAQVAGLVPEKVRIDLPVVVDGAVSDIAQVGSRIVVAGTFTSVKPTAAGVAVAQKYLFAYDLATGAFDPNFRPVLDGAVESVEASADGSALYIGGAFSNVSGVARKRLARLSAAGVVDPAFVANASSKVSAIEVGGSRIFVGGKFTSINGTARGGLASLDARTGAVKSNFNLPIAGGIGFGGELTVKGLGLTPDRATLVVSFTGQTIGGESRVGVATIDVAAPIAAVTPWRTNLFQDGLVERGGQLWLRGFDISPDGSYFVVTSSGGDSPPINDMAIAFPVDGGDGVEPRWLSRHFDSVYAAAIDSGAVYIGGHFRYQQAPGSIDPYPGDPTANYSFSTGPNGIGAGVLGDQVVSRVQVGALDPATGDSLPWNPGADGFNGVTALTVVPRGLLLGHDGASVGAKIVGRHGFFDRNLAVTETNDSTVTAPLTGQILTADQSTVITGRATAPSGVKRVQVTVQNRRTKAYLQANGTWAATWAGLVATLDSQGTSVTWRYPFVIPGGGFEITSRTFAVNATKEADLPKTSVEAYSTNDSAPETRAFAAELGGAAGRTVTLTGTATDDRGVTSVRVSLRNQTANHHLRPNGQVGDFYEFEATLDRPGLTGTNWTLLVDLPTDGRWYIEAKAIDTISQRDGSSAAVGWDLFPNDLPPTITMSSPADGVTVHANGTVEISGSATDDRGVAGVKVYVVNLSTYQGMVGVGLLGDRASWVSATLSTPNGTSTAWTLTSPSLPAGRYQIQVYATDTGAQETPPAGWPLRYINVQITGDNRPALMLSTPGNVTIADPNVIVSGTASDDLGVSEVQVAIYSNGAPQGWLQADGTVNSTSQFLFSPSLGVPGGTSTSWSFAVRLPHAAQWSIRAYSLDTQLQPSNPSWTYPRFSLNDAAPTFSIDTPTEGQVIAGATTIGVNGVVEDDVAVDRVVAYFYRNPFWEGPNKANVGTAPGIYDAFITNPGGKRSNWSLTSPPLAPGRWTLYSYAIDRSGQNSAATYRTFDIGVVGDAPPVAMIDSPTYAKTDFAANAFTMNGRATDDKGVVSVTMRILQQGGAWLKPDGTTTGSPGDAVWTATLASPGAASTTWTLPVNLPTGGYYIYAVATDSVNQRQVQSTWANGGQNMPIWVSPGDAIPVVTMTTPTANSTISGAGFIVSGTATDDVGVKEAWVLIRRSNNPSEGYRRDGSIGAAEYVAATLSSPNGQSTNWTLSTLNPIPAGTWEVYVYVTDTVTKQAWSSATNLTVT